jgi:hypothetical protein
MLEYRDKNIELGFFILIAAVRRRLRRVSA